MTGLKVFLSTVGVLAFAAFAAAGQASATVGNATTVGPAGDAFAITLSSSTASFTSSNGMGVSVTCTSSSGAGAVPAAPNNASSGSVTSLLTSPISFGGTCMSVLGTATVTESGGEYLDAQSFNSTGSDTTNSQVIGVGVNQDGYTLSVPQVPCTIDVSPNGASAVLGAFTNGSTGPPVVPSQAAIDEQVDFSGCGLTAPAVEQATYNVTDTTNPASVITINP